MWCPSDLAYKIKELFDVMSIWPSFTIKDIVGDVHLT